VKLKLATAPAWVAAVLGDFDAFLLDHAACERKASAAALAFVAHYPDRPELVAGRGALAREELEHFQRSRSGRRAGPRPRRTARIHVRALAAPPARQRQCLDAF
jgi:tRNA isopentenyl-2-thiomethyl-A-37 hydroxylase MiaE